MDSTSLFFFSFHDPENIYFGENSLLVRFDFCFVASASLSSYSFLLALLFIWDRAPALTFIGLSKVAREVGDGLGRRHRGLGRVGFSRCAFYALEMGNVWQRGKIFLWILRRHSTTFLLVCWSENGWFLMDGDHCGPCYCRQEIEKGHQFILRPLTEFTVGLDVVDRIIISKRKGRWAQLLSSPKEIKLPWRASLCLTQCSSVGRDGVLRENNTHLRCYTRWWMTLNDGNNCDGV